MGNIFTKGCDVDNFLLTARQKSYSMKESLIKRSAAERISQELKGYGLLEDLVERVPTDNFKLLDMTNAAMLHRALNSAICKVTDEDENHLPLFSVRVFEPGVHGTTIHRNDPSIGPWAVGITLSGSAPFSVYPQNLLSGSWDTTLELIGYGDDPLPEASLDTSAGSAWTLYTANEQKPHSGGLVESENPRELLILYGMQDWPDTLPDY